MTTDQIRRIKDAIADCSRFITKEEIRNPALRPAETSELLDFYRSHKVTLEGMLK